MVHLSFSNALLVALAAGGAVQAHTAFTTLFVNGQDQGDGTCIRMKRDGYTATFPVPGVSTNDLACNVDGEKGVARVCPVEDGATLSFEFRASPGKPNDVVLDRSHKGPCAVYVKKVDSAIDDPGHGDGWSKIWHEGYDETDGRWCTDKLIDNGGFLSVKLPPGLKGGYYLVRPEVLALHLASAGDPQFYTGCAQIFLESSGDAEPTETVSIPGYVDVQEPGLSYNIYVSPPEEYPIPGPELAEFASGSNYAQQAEQTEGLKPEGCILENDNWCAMELDDYSTEQECWDTVDTCYAQADTCWKTALPSGNKGCQVFSDEKCKVISEGCSSRQFSGPPNKGVDITPTKRSPNLPSPYGMGSSGSQGPSPFSGGSSSTSATTSAVSSSSTSSTSVSDDSTSSSAEPSTSSGAETSTQDSSPTSQTSVAGSGSSSSVKESATSTSKATPTATVVADAEEEDDEECDKDKVNVKADAKADAKADKKKTKPSTTAAPTVRACAAVTETVSVTVYETVYPKVRRYAPHLTI